MGQFGIETRKWLESAIRQRKFLLKNNKSHKPQIEEEVCIQTLEGLLGAYSYENDLNMAKFIRQNIACIENILPGSGAKGYQKRIDELSAVNKRAILIIENNYNIRTPTVYKNL